MNKKIETYNNYLGTKKFSGESENYKKYISRVFNNHYFSNHWDLAKKLEADLINITKKRNCVTYMNSSIALISSLHILGVKEGDTIYLGRGVNLFNWVISCIKYLNLNVCKEYNNDTNITSIVLDIDLLSHETNRHYILIPSSLYTKDNINNNTMIIYNMDRETCFNMYSGAFVATNNDVLAHKLRHMRSSYGRTGDVTTKINGNGRFSEFQAAEALTSLDIDFQIILSQIFNETIQFISKFRHKSTLIGDYYTSPILFIEFSDNNLIEKVILKLKSMNNENQIINYETLDSRILIRVPLTHSVSKNLFISLLAC